MLPGSALASPEAIHVAASDDLAELDASLLSTKTVLGFLDFTTTVSDTVIQFTSQGGNFYILHVCHRVKLFVINAI